MFKVDAVVALYPDLQQVDGPRLDLHRHGRLGGQAQRRRHELDHQEVEELGRRDKVPETVEVLVDVALAQRVPEGKGRAKHMLFGWELCAHN